MLIEKTFTDININNAQIIDMKFVKIVEINILY